MIVSMWMSRDVVTITPDCSISEAAFMMAHRHVRQLAVADALSDGPHLVGMLARSDIFAAFPTEINPFSANAVDRFQSSVTVGEIMSRELITTTPETPIERAARSMSDHKIGALPVIRNTQLVGLITKSDIFSAFLELMNSESGEARITFHALPHEDAWAFVLSTAQECNIRVMSVFWIQHAGQPMCVVRVNGPGIDQFVDALCQAHHPPINVVRT